MAKLRFEIVTGERLVFSADDVDMVVAPGTDGELGVLPRHAPLVTTLKPGVLRVKQGVQETEMAVSGGFMEVRPDRVTVLADTAERATEIDEARAEESRQRAQEVLEAGWPEKIAAREAYADFDAWLRAVGHQRNPGTTADLIAAGLFVALHEGTIPLPCPWPWSRDGIVL